MLFLHISSSWVKIRFYTEKELPRLCGRGLIILFDCSEEASRDIDDLKILDESPHGVSMVSLFPEVLDFSALKVGFLCFLFS